MQITETPTSPKTAAHMLAMPRAPRIRTTSFTMRAKVIFCIAMLTVRRAMRMVTGIFLRSSSMMTTSAASMAASEPMEPMAIPMSALARTGASLIPSPIKASSAFPSLCPFMSKAPMSSSTFETLSWGSSSAKVRSTPSSFPTASPTSFLSPVSMTMLSTPAFFISRIASFASGFISSFIRMAPRYLTPSPSDSATWETVADGSLTPA